jgi:hypothetical protein
LTRNEGDSVTCSPLGEADGGTVGRDELKGEADGCALGWDEVKGEPEGRSLGRNEGDAFVGVALGSVVGTIVVGECVLGLALGFADVGSEVGRLLGVEEVGALLGFTEGALLGALDVGAFVGNSVGSPCAGARVASQIRMGPSSLVTGSKHVPVSPFQRHPLAWHFDLHGMLQYALH